MPYAAFDDVIKRYNPITTMIGSGSTDVATVDVSSIYIADAEGIINAYLGAKYAVPLQIEPMVTMLASDISIYKMLEDRASRVPEIAEKRYTRALDLLAMLRDGKMTLSSSQTQISSGDWEAFATTMDYHPVFSPVLNEIDQRADLDQIQAERSERESDI
jgi:phage gp36-like protein